MIDKDSTAPYRPSRTPKTSGKCAGQNMVSSQCPHNSPFFAIRTPRRESAGSSERHTGTEVLPILVVEALVSLLLLRSARLRVREGGDAKNYWSGLK